MRVLVASAKPKSTILKTICQFNQDGYMTGYRKYPIYHLLAPHRRDGKVMDERMSDDTVRIIKTGDYQRRIRSSCERLICAMFGV